jgi:hypothetical protein
LKLGVFSIPLAIFHVFFSFSWFFSQDAHLNCRCMK